MSADNWTKCPACEAELDEKYVTAVNKLQKSYGKISAEEYVEKFKELQVRPVLKDTLREDYQIGITDGVFHIEYRAQCYTCNKKFSYDLEQKADLK